MTKEMILATKNWSTEYPNFMAESEILDAMDEYAKQQAIAFMNWAMDNEKIVGNSAGSVFTNEPDDNLYNQFVEQQNKP
jgi:hypothetical protein